MGKQLATCIAVLLWCPMVWANHFESENAGLRFKLAITASGLAYSSESLKANISLQTCNRELIHNLNGELISLLPRTAQKKGVRLFIDRHPVILDPQGPLVKEIFNMDKKILKVQLLERSLCKR